MSSEENVSKAILRVFVNVTKIQAGKDVLLTLQNINGSYITETKVELNRPAHVDFHVAPIVQYWVKNIKLSIPHGFRIKMRFTNGDNGAVDYSCSNDFNAVSIQFTKSDDSDNQPLLVVYSYDHKDDDGSLINSLIEDNAITKRSSPAPASVNVGTGPGCRMMTITVTGPHLHEAIGSTTRVVIGPNIDINVCGGQCSVGSNLKVNYGRLMHLLLGKGQIQSKNSFSSQCIPTKFESLSYMYIDNTVDPPVATFKTYANAKVAECSCVHAYSTS